MSPVEGSPAKPEDYPHFMSVYVFNPYLRDAGEYNQVEMERQCIHAMMGECERCRVVSKLYTDVELTKHLILISAPMIKP